MRPISVLALLALSAVVASPVHAAESFDGCKGFITSLPATITTQGVWCLKGDLATSQTSGNAIQVDTNNVVIDCNGYKIGGLAGGAASVAVGVATTGSTNVTVRGCTVRGFGYGVQLDGFGHQVEDNRIEGSTRKGISITASPGMVRNNRVVDSGNDYYVTNLYLLFTAYGIDASGEVDIIDNTVDGVVSAAVDGNHAPVTGIRSSASTSNSITGNRIRGIENQSTASVRGIVVSTASSRAIVRDNHVFGSSLADSIGISCSATTQATVGNVITGWPTAETGCTSAANVIVP